MTQCGVRVKNTALELNPADQHDHRCMIRHLRQHAGRVALLACRSLSPRGRQQSQEEAGMRVALSAPGFQDIV